MLYYENRIHIDKELYLEALDIFFNDGNGVIKLEKTGLNIQVSRNGDNETVISVCFSERPESIIKDLAVQTTLVSEYMLNSDDFLEVVKKHKSGGETCAVEFFQNRSRMESCQR